MTVEIYNDTETYEKTFGFEVGGPLRTFLDQLWDKEEQGGMAKIIDTNRHGIRREIDHQFKPKKKIRPNRSKDTNSKPDNKSK